MTFHESIHCQSRRHCRTCRTRGARRWREGIRKAFPELCQVDFACPDGRDWIESPWDVAVREIQAAPGSDDWATLKTQLTQTQAMIEIHGERLGTCWIARQHRRLAFQWAWHKLTAASLQPPCTPSPTSPA